MNRSGTYKVAATGGRKGTATGGRKKRRSKRGRKGKKGGFIGPLLAAAAPALGNIISSLIGRSNKQGSGVSPMKLLGSKGSTKMGSGMKRLRRMK